MVEGCFIFFCKSSTIFPCVVGLCGLRWRSLSLYFSFIPPLFHISLFAFFRDVFWSNLVL
ncbi:hypothetical protein BDZ97DRAFT_1815749, partial [Flammula alnicola]